MKSDKEYLEGIYLRVEAHNYNTNNRRTFWRFALRVPALGIAFAAIAIVSLSAMRNSPSGLIPVSIKPVPYEASEPVTRDLKALSDVITDSTDIVMVTEAGDSLEVIRQLKGNTDFRKVLLTRDLLRPDQNPESAILCFQTDGKRLWLTDIFTEQHKLYTDSMGARFQLQQLEELLP